MNGRQFDALLKAIEAWPEGARELESARAPHADLPALKERWLRERPGLAWFVGFAPERWTAPAFDPEVDVLLPHLKPLVRGERFEGDEFPTIEAWRRHAEEEIERVCKEARALGFPSEGNAPRGRPGNRRKEPEDQDGSRRLVPVQWRYWMLAGRLLGHSTRAIAAEFSATAKLGNITHTGVTKTIRKLATECEVPAEVLSPKESGHVTPAPARPRR